MKQITRVTLKIWNTNIRQIYVRLMIPKVVKASSLKVSQGFREGFFCH